MSAKLSYTFLHTHEAQAIAPQRSGVESAAVIGHGSHDPSTSCLQRDFDSMRSGMLGDIRESLLNHSVETSAVGVGKVIERGIQRSLDLYATRSRNFSDQPRQGRSQTQIVEHRGPEQHGYVSNHAKSLLDDAHRMRDPRGKLTSGIAGRSR